MHSYVDIKAAATKLLNDSTAPESVKHAANILVMIADRMAKLEERHGREIEDLKTRLRQQQIKGGPRL